MLPNLDLLLLSLLHCTLICCILLVLISLTLITLSLVFTFGLLSLALFALYNISLDISSDFAALKVDLQLGLLWVLCTSLRSAIMVFLAVKPAFSAIVTRVESVKSNSARRIKAIAPFGYS